MLSRSRTAWIFTSAALLAVTAAGTAQAMAKIATGAARAHTGSQARTYGRYPANRKFGIYRTRAW